MALRVLVTRRLPYVVTALKTAFGPTGVEIVQWDSESDKVPQDFLLENVKACDALFCLLTDTVDEAVIEAAGPKLKVVSTMSVGHNHVDSEACKARGVAVGYTPGVLDDTTAELTVALLFATTRKVSKRGYAAGKQILECGWACRHGRASSTI